MVKYKVVTATSDSSFERVMNCAAERLNREGCTIEKVDTHANQSKAVDTRTIYSDPFYCAVFHYKEEEK